MKTAAVLLHALGVSLEVVDDEAHVVDAVEILAALVAGGVVAMELEQREVDDAVGEGEPVAIGGFDVVHFLETERLLVELGRRLELGDRDRDVTKLRCHENSSSA